MADEGRRGRQGLIRDAAAGRACHRISTRGARPLFRIRDRKRIWKESHTFVIATSAPQVLAFFTQWMG